MIDNFEVNNAEGKRGEALMINALIKRGHTIENLSDIEIYQGVDTDLRISKNGITITLEVKNDIKSHYYDNVFVETYNRNNTTRCGDGWYYYCNADYIAFVQENYKLAHIVDTSELIKDCQNKRYREASSDFSRGYLVPIKRLKEYSSYHCMDLR